MAKVEKTVFISYRRTDVYTALAVYQDLTIKGYDVFFDYTSIPSGDFEQIILSNIRARAHFVLVLTPTALDRCNEPGDWLRREIETAMDEKRNIIPLFFKNFIFSTPSVADKLTGKLANLNRYNGMNVHEDYFHAAMERLSGQFLSVPLDTVLHPMSTEVKKAVKKEQIAADEAVKQGKGSVKEEEPEVKEESQLEKLKSQAIQFELKGDFWNALETYYKIKKIDPKFPRVDKKIEELERELQPKPVTRKEAVPAKRSGSVERKTWSRPVLRPYAMGIGALLFVILGVFGVKSLVAPTTADVTHVSPTSTPAWTIGDTMVSDADGMVLLYVPEGSFLMGSEEGGDADERPVHSVYVPSFWMDQTEVTNEMYLKCVQAGSCDPPTNGKSKTRKNYYAYPEFNNYPVIYVTWYDANSYCSWADRRLPTEAEWEKAAGWDSINDRKSLYPWGERINCDLANYESNVGSCESDTTPVDTGSKSPYGLYGMGGDVWEWVADWYSSDYYESSTLLNPKGSDSGIQRVARGGAWTSTDTDVRVTNRGSFAPSANSFSIGFRCALSD